VAYTGKKRGVHADNMHAVVWVGVLCLAPLAPGMWSLGQVTCLLRSDVVEGGVYRQSDPGAPSGLAKCSMNWV